jgi:hypothetical protein
MVRETHLATHHKKLQPKSKTTTSLLSKHTTPKKLQVPNLGQPQKSTFLFLLKNNKNWSHVNHEIGYAAVYTGELRLHTVYLFLKSIYRGTPEVNRVELSYKSHLPQLTV